MAVVGTGLIGTSIALAASRREVTVYLMDHDESTAREAAALGAGILGPPLKPVDLAVLATPPSLIGPVLAEQETRGLARRYTDVASVKSMPERDVLRGIADPTRYVGGHPIAGRERSGPLASRADLFERRLWVLTPSRFTAPETVERAIELVSLCGAVPIVMNSRAHDDAVALISHVPHVLASLMAARLQHAPAEVTQLAGQGLRDVTRIAAGDPALWSDILQANAEPVAKILTEVAEDLTSLRTALQDGDHSQLTKQLVTLLNRGVAGVSRLESDLWLPY
jgi:prephenate dehydrogenase